MEPYLIVGWIGFVATIIAAAQKNDRRFYLFNVVSILIWATSYFLNAKYAAFGMLLVIACRYVLAMKLGGARWAFLFALIHISVGVVMWSSPLDILTILSATTMSFAIFLLRGIPLRAVTIVSSMTWCAYSVLINYPPGILIEIFTSTTLLITIYRLARDGEAKGIVVREVE